jgi:glycosyltransferase involved in cell wall biosynthesis
LSTRNLEAYYRVDLTIEAFARFKAAVPGATLTIAGFGSEEQRLRELAASRAGDAIHFVGRVVPEDMPALCGQHDIFVNASVLDNQPVSILEAFAAGLAVVSTATGDIPFMSRQGELAVLVPPADAVALADGISTVWQRQDEARRRVALARAEVARYTWPAVRDQWAEIYSASGAHDHVALVPEARSVSDATRC